MPAMSLCLAVERRQLVQGPHDVALVAQRAFGGAHRRVPHAFAQCGIRPQQHAVIAGVLKMQMTEQAAIASAARSGIGSIATSTLNGQPAGASVA